MFLSTAQAAGCRRRIAIKRRTFLYFLVFFLPKWCHRDLLEPTPDQIGCLQVLEKLESDYFLMLKVLKNTLNEQKSLRLNSFLISR